MTDFWTNSTLTEVVYLYWTTINAYLFDSIIFFRDTKDKNWLSIFDSLPESFQFDDFQYSLLKAFLIILVINLVLIFISWKIYGKRICDRFMKPATSKAIEELKASVSKLKLPKEHTPRI